jgi:hypothetical protein
VPKSVTLESLPDFARYVLSAATNKARELPETRTLCLPGLTLEVYLDRGRLAEAVATAFLPAPAADATTDRPSARIFVVHPGFGSEFDPPIGIGDLHQRHRFASRLAECGMRGDYYHDLLYWQFYDLNNRIGVQVMSGPDSFPPWDPGAPLRPFLHWEYGARGMRLAHAGTLGRDGIGILLAGGGGAGKSGTVVAGLGNSLDSVGDDYVLVDFCNGVTAFPLFSTLKQDPTGFARLGLQDKLPKTPALNWQGKHQFRIQDIVSRPIPAQLRIVALMVPAITGGDTTSIAPLARKDALMALAPSGIAQMPGDREGGFRFFSQITRLLPCYRLSLGSRPEEISGVVADFLNGA